MLFLICVGPLMPLMSESIFTTSFFRLKTESLLKYAISRAESIHLLRGTVRAKVRSRISVEALPQTGKAPTRPVV